MLSILNWNGAFHRCIFFKSLVNRHVNLNVENVYNLRCCYYFCLRSFCFCFSHSFRINRCSNFFFSFVRNKFNLWCCHWQWYDRGFSYFVCLHRFCYRFFWLLTFSSVRKRMIECILWADTKILEPNQKKTLLLLCT